MTTKITFLAFMLTLCLRAQTVIPDDAFGTNGIFQFANNNTGRQTIASAVQPDGKIIIAGDRINGDVDEEPFIARLNADGNIDTSFGNNGFFTDFELPFSTNPDIQLIDDSIFIVYGEPGILLKLDTDGALDTAFGTDGVLENIGNGNNESVLMNGTLFTANVNSFNAVNITTGEITNTNITSINNIVAIHKGPNQSLLLSSINEENLSSFLTKIDANGIIDQTFGTNGTITTNIAADIDEFDNAFDFIGVDSSNNIYYSTTVGFSTIIQKFDAFGNSISSFGTNGRFTIEESITIEFRIFNDQLYLTGGHSADSGETINLFVARLNSNGTLDSNFNTSGLYVFDTNSNQEFADNINIISEGTFIVSGNTTGTPRSTNYVGKFLVEDNLSTTDNIKTNTTLRFENPVTSQLRFSANAKIETITLFTIDGKRLNTGLGNSIPTTHLTNGIYISKVKMQNGSIITKRVVKM